MKNVPEPARDLLAAVLEALDIPFPATIGDRETHDRILNDRVMQAKIALRSALEDAPLGIVWTTQYLREQLAELAPTGYRHHGTPTPPACQRCRKPFDESDTRFDGHARHQDTAYCRACVDNCHEGGAEHVCVICDPQRYGGEGR
ncbi:hypothetical protein ACFY3G_14935 [Streptomyces phaeochromogenes]|uniref:hypothetical protein n=1 Tax=Streptomyces phaeochromogenes TaxID=1923 RepID=UPI00369D4716